MLPAQMYTEHSAISVCLVRIVKLLYGVDAAWCDVV